MCSDCFSNEGLLAVWSIDKQAVSHCLTCAGTHVKESDAREVASYNVGCFETGV